MGGWYMVVIEKFFLFIVRSRAGSENLSHFLLRFPNFVPLINTKRLFSFVTLYYYVITNIEVFCQTYYWETIAVVLSRFNNYYSALLLALTWLDLAESGRPLDMSGHLLIGL